MDKTTDNLPREEGFPKNSKFKREAELKEEKREVTSIVSSAKRKKKGFGKKLEETFLEDDTKNVGSYILYDVLIPAAKAMISDMVTGGIEMLLFGERKISGGRRDVGRGYTNYGSFSRNDVRNEKRELSRLARSRHDFDDILFDTRGEADLVLSYMSDDIRQYGEVSVATFYGLCGLECTFADENYGWTDIRGSGVRRDRQGYCLILPRPVAL